MAFQHCLRQRFPGILLLVAIDDLLQSPMDQLAQGFRGEASRRWINRCQGPRQRRKSMYYPAFWVDHLGPEKTGANLPQQSYALAFRISFYLAAIKVEKAYEKGAAAILHLAHQLASRPKQNFAARDIAFDLNRLVQGDIANRLEVCFVIVPQRQMQYQVEFAGDIQLGK